MKLQPNRTHGYYVWLHVPVVRNDLAKVQTIPGPRGQLNCNKNGAPLTITSVNPMGASGQLNMGTPNGNRQSPPSGGQQMNPNYMFSSGNGPNPAYGGQMGAGDPSNPMGQNVGVQGMGKRQFFDPSKFHRVQRCERE